MPLEYSMIFACIIGIIFLLVLGRLFLIPVKIVLQLVYRVLLGGVLLLVMNLFSGVLGFSIGLNIATALTAGILGFPGVVMMVVLKHIFSV